MAKVGHQLTRYKKIPWLVCRFCGLVGLNNEATRKRLKQWCDDE